MQFDDVDIVWDRFKKRFVQVLNEVAPCKEIRIKQRTEPWMTDSILKDIKERNNSLKSFKKDGNNDNYIKFKRKRNEIRCKI